MMADQDDVKVLVETIRRIDERTMRIADDVDALKHVVLEGNGTPALTVQVASLRERVTAVELSKKAKYALWVALITAIGGIASTALGVF